MSFDPILHAPGLIQFHIATAVFALFTGPFVILRRRRDRLHKYLGYSWFFAMCGVAISALFIPSFGIAIIGHLGPIHGLAILTLLSLGQGMMAIWRKDIVAHERTLASLYWTGLAVAGLINFLPGRRINEAIFGGATEPGYAIIIVGGLLLFWFRVARHWFQPQNPQDDGIPS